MRGSREEEENKEEKFNFDQSIRSSSVVRSCFQQTSRGEAIIDIVSASFSSNLVSLFLRYCMGVGYPIDLVCFSCSEEDGESFLEVVCVALGVDMFDCVYPARTARFGVALTDNGNMVRGGGGGWRRRKREKGRRKRMETDFWIPQQLKHKRYKKDKKPIEEVRSQLQEQS
eukprot:764796-Hanusia_phi.AAC.2